MEYYNFNYHVKDSNNQVSYVNESIEAESLDNAIGLLVGKYVSSEKSLTDSIEVFPPNTDKGIHFEVSEII